MGRERTAQTKEVTKAIFEVLLVGGLVITAGALSNGNNIDKMVKGYAKYGVWRIRQTIKRLKLQGMVVYDEEDERSPIILTEKGMKRAITYRFFDVFSRQTKWDHFWRIVMFDIPEHWGKRKNFQRSLVVAGFYRLQDSVYTTPYDFSAEIVQYAKAHGISSGLLQLTVPNLGPFERRVRRHFLKQLS